MGLSPTKATEFFFSDEITIIGGDNDVQEFEAKKQRVLDDILQSGEERFSYLENGPVLKTATVLHADVWSKDPMQIFV